MEEWCVEGVVPKVSIICNTYNHGAYIDDAIRGFLLQKTSFPFEIIIHDDASTDGTKEIIKDYALRYPSLIRPIFQTENQYSLGRKPTIMVLPYVKGTYIAMCEGDDFWINRNKLTMQVSSMERNPELNLCFHSAWLIGNNERVERFCDHGDRETTLSCESIIRRGGPYMPTASLLFKSKVFREIVNSNASFFELYNSGYFIQVFNSIPDGAYYLPDSMSVYRYEADGSWTQGVKQDSIKFVRAAEKFLCAATELEKMTDNSYQVHLRHAMRWKVLGVLNNDLIPVKERRRFYALHESLLSGTDVFLWKFVISRKFIHKFAKRIREGHKLIRRLF
jgi:glycosyltransferase involved in cell wall biosynthesis